MLKLKKKLQEDMATEIRKDYPKPKIKTEECTRWFSSYDPGTTDATIVAAAVHECVVTAVVVGALIPL